MEAIWQAIHQPIWAQLALSLTILVSAIFYLARWKGFASKKDRLHAMGISTVFIGLLSVLLFAFTVENIPGESLVYDTENNLVSTVFTEDSHLWPWDIRISGREVKSYSAFIHTVQMSVSPITENPEVRRLAYNVVVEANGTPEDFLLFGEGFLSFGNSYTTVNDLSYKILVHSSLNSWLEYQLYEFNDSSSKKLAYFYNPLDKKQQEDFSRLISDFLEPQLAGSGVRFTSATFSLP